jgi:hypothetical protein
MFHLWNYFMDFEKIWKLGVFTESSVTFKLCPYLPTIKSQSSSVGIVAGYGLDGLGLIPGIARLFFYSIQTGSGAHPASNPIGTGGKVARA